MSGSVVHCSASIGALVGDALLILCNQYSTQCNLIDVNNTHVRMPLVLCARSYTVLLKAM